MISVDSMTDPALLCTHCQVAMTSWAAPGSPIRYYQCPFCARTHASCYGEVFKKGAGARRAGQPLRASSPETLPQASDQEIQWAGVKARAARWFARLEADEAGQTRCRPAASPPRLVPARAGAVAVGAATRAR